MNNAFADSLKTLEYVLENFAYYNGARRDFDACRRALDDVMATEEYRSWPETQQGAFFADVLNLMYDIEFRIHIGMRLEKEEVGRTLARHSGWVPSDHDGDPGSSVWTRAA